MGVKRKRTSGGTRPVVLDRTFAPKSYSLKNKKATKVKGIKKVKVSPALSAKIKKVIEKKVLSIKGSCTDLYIGGQLQAKSRKQAIYDKLVSNCPAGSWHFTVDMFLDVANVLFGDKTPVTAPDAKYRTVPIGGDVNQLFSTKNTTFVVNNSWSTYTFKNNSQHLVHLVLYIGVPKQRGGNCLWAPESKNVQIQNGGTVLDLEAYQDLKTCWEEGLLDDERKGYQLRGFRPDNTLTNAVNILAPSIEDFERSPDSCKALKHFYKVQTVKLMLQPGQEVIHHIQGPRKQTIDFSKLYKGQILMNVQKYSRSVIGAVINSPNATAQVDANGAITSAVSGRWKDYIDNETAGFCIHTERKDHFSIVMPEQTGFEITSATVGDVQFLNKRFSKAIYNVIDKPAEALGANKTNEVIDLSVMNPQQPVKAGPGTGT